MQEYDLANSYPWVGETVGLEKTADLQAAIGFIWGKRLHKPEKAGNFEMPHEVWLCHTVCGAPFPLRGHNPAVMAPDRISTE